MQVMTAMNTRTVDGYARVNPSRAWILLTTRSPSVLLGSRGHGAMTSSDAAGLLAGLYREAFLMGMLVECGSMGDLLELHDALFDRVARLAYSRQWKLAEQRGQQIVKRMTALALYETLDDKRCPTCNGKGTTTFNLDEYPDLMFAPTFEQLNGYEGRLRCRSCLGSSRVKLSARKRADLSGIHKDSWIRMWASRYEEVFTIPRDWLSDARRHMAQRSEMESETA